MLELCLGLVYLAVSLVVAAYSASFFVLLLFYARHARHAPIAPTVPDDVLLSVTVQLPIYNERHVVERLLDAVCALDYPRNRLVIQVLDDSTDDTTDLLRRKVADWQARGINVSLIRRDNRTGFKAGALAHGLEQCDTDCVAVFDADFVPAPDFLRRAMPHFHADPQIALVQTRISHLNTAYNPLTRAQALALDQHVAVEQVARSRGQLPMSMNGTGGIWRRTALVHAGGWQAATLTEDMDLSYRAYLRGWRFRYLVDVAVPGELPPHLTAYKVQQARWAQGSTQCLRRHAGALVRADLSLVQKWMGLLHLGQFAIQPFLLLLMLLTPPLLLTDALSWLPLGPLGIAGMAPSLIIVLGQATLYNDWPRRLLWFPALLLLGMGMMPTNSRAVLAGLLARGSHTFRRTPKFGRTSDPRHGQRTTKRRYAIAPDWTTLGELALAVYAVLGFGVAVLRWPGMAGYMLMYAVAFGLTAGISLWQHQS